MFVNDAQDCPLYLLSLSTSGSVPHAAPTPHATNLPHRDSSSNLAQLVFQIAKH